MHTRVSAPCSDRWTCSTGSRTSDASQRRTQARDDRRHAPPPPTQERGRRRCPRAAARHATATSTTSKPTSITATGQTSRQSTSATWTCRRWRRCRPSFRPSCGECTGSRFSGSQPAPPTYPTSSPASPSSGRTRGRPLPRTLGFCWWRASSLASPPCTPPGLPRGPWQRRRRARARSRGGICAWGPVGSGH